MSRIRNRYHNAPHCIYFYYLKYPQGSNRADPPPMKVYYYFDEHDPISGGNTLKEKIEMLANNASLEDFVPPPCGDKVSSVWWRRKSYLVFLLDDTTNTFPNEDALKIVYQGPEEEDNHSFFNAEKLEIDLPGRTVTALVCTNLMQHRTGRNLRRGEKEKFSVSLGFDDARTFQYEGDDGGTNQGGPVPPPSPA